MAPHVIPLGILSDIDNERLRQLEKWGVQRHPAPVWMTILTEEVGEAARAIMDHTYEKVKPSRVENPGDLRAELVQVAAVAVAWIEDLDRR